MVTAILLVFGLRDGRSFEAVRAEVGVYVGGHAILAARHFAVAAEIEVGQRCLLGT